MLPSVRSRPTLEVHYSPRHPRPGDRIHFEARLVARTDTPIDNAIFRFRGREKRLHHPMGKTVVSLEHVHLDMMAEGGEDVLRAGETRVLPFEFDLPLTLPPSYRSALSSIEYVLESRIDIPWWPDRTANYAIRVWPAPQKQKKARSAFVATSPRGPVGKELHMELTLDGTTLELGGEVSGAILLENVRHHTVRRLQLAAVLMDAPVDSGSSFGPREVFRSEPMVLATNPPQSGRPYPFSLRLPSGVVPSFTGRQVQVRWYLEARAVIAFGRDVVLSAGLHVSQPFEGDEPVEAPTKTKTHAPRSGPMGRERRALVWAEVARSAGLMSEGEGETMTGSVGPVQVTVMLELRGDVLHSVGILKWPALGLGLEVAERRWSDAFGAAVPLNDEPFDKRFTVHCRPGASVREVLDREVREQLLSFERISVEDEGAELTTVGNGYTVTELGAFVRGVLLTAPSWLRPSRTLRRTRRCGRRSRPGARWQRSSRASCVWVTFRFEVRATAKRPSSSSPASVRRARPSAPSRARCSTGRRNPTQSPCG